MPVIKKDADLQTVITTYEVTPPGTCATCARKSASLATSSSRNRRGGSSARRCM